MNHFRIYIPRLIDVVRGFLGIARGRAEVTEAAWRRPGERFITAHPLMAEVHTFLERALGGRTAAAPAAGPPEQLPEPISQAEARVLRFLQTSLSAPEIARELYVSVNTVRTHMRHLYDKLGAHRRLQALDRARALGLLTPA